ncbi:hypothetical protein [Aquipseudomonas guryensis]|uniref:Uncharacterized protein n=1 Tax=Aquipseudomonas guryensis TaxID=2759165 RepID=A0A7W4DAK6_9GAMM|nr:hypothetical protein [Pseudomonas guryensis]MBB1518752.1 hypothetical protein [Pseudomonas guryensis]
MHTLNASPLLRRALLADGLVGLGTGSLLVLAAGWFAELLALPRELLLGAGLALLPLGVFLLWLGSGERVNRLLVWVVLALNALWVVDSLLLLVAGWVTPNLLGHFFVIAQALVVLLFIELELLGLKRSEPVVA